MKETTFRFKQFNIIQQKSAMKVGTDGVLLGALGKGAQAKNILDIGTGTGLIAIMLAQRFVSVIDAVEIDLNAAGEAMENAKNCPWNHRIKIFHSSFQEYVKTCNTRYQLIVSNPPFFQNSLKSPTRSKNQARHNDSLPIQSLFDGVNNLLAQDGIFQIIIPADNVEEYFDVALTYDLFCTEIVWVKPTPSKEPKRVVLEFSRFLIRRNEITLVIEIEGRHQYSKEYKHLTRDFYLAL